MGRLTARKEDRYFENEEFWVDAEEPSIDKIDDVYFKLAEFEDFMEEEGFEDLESFKWTLNFMKDLNKVGAKTLIENQALQDRWQKLKEWALYMCYFELADKMEELEDGKDTNVPSKNAHYTEQKSAKDAQ